MNHKIVRRPAVAGMFYPADPSLLQEAIEQYMDSATPDVLPGVRAIIAPHAGYVYSGPVAAFAYKLLAAQSAPPQRIYVLGPSHRMWFTGVALGDYDAFQTPLGDVPVDREQIARLMAEGASESLLQITQSPHAPEHCLEVQLPFLQMVYPGVPIVPMLFGEVDPIAIGKLLTPLLEANDLIVVSSDLSHYHNETRANELDHQFLDAVLESNKTAVARGEACGQSPVLTLITIAEVLNWQPHLLHYQTSGAVSGDYHQVVGYAAVAYVEGA
ncbi:MAG: AmmeMemoRadiSam system protein B [Anaerolineae bacterium]|nr:AmmeMemoRadiSam system protein B [Anaerolineae bacterium]